MKINPWKYNKINEKINEERPGVTDHAKLKGGGFAWGCPANARLSYI